MYSSTLPGSEPLLLLSGRSRWVSGREVVEEEVEGCERGWTKEGSGLEVV